MPAAERLDYWVDAVSDGFLAMEVSSPQRLGFDSELHSARLGALGLNRVQGRAQDVFRTRRAIARSRENYH